MAVSQPTIRMEEERIIEVETRFGKEEIHTIRTGNGPCRFLVWHGFNSVNRLFHWNYLHKFGEVIRIGLPGHGPVNRKSWSHYRTWTQDHFIETGVAICEFFENKGPVFLVGHSMGGHIALGVTTRIPKSIGGLVLVNPMVWSPFNRLVKFLAKSFMWRPIGTLALAPGLRKAQYSAESFLENLQHVVKDHEAFYGNPNTISYVKAGHNDYRRNNIAPIVAAARVAATFDLRPAILSSKVDVPTLIVHGDKDPVSPIAQSEWVAQQLSQATLVRLPGVGHVSYGEREHEFAELITRWVAEQLGRAHIKCTPALPGETFGCKAR